MKTKGRIWNRKVHTGFVCVIAIEIGLDGSIITLVASGGNSSSDEKEEEMKNDFHLADSNLVWTRRKYIVRSS